MDGNLRFQVTAIYSPTLPLALTLIIRVRFADVGGVSQLQHVFSSRLFASEYCSGDDGDRRDAVKSVSRINLQIKL